MCKHPKSYRTPEFIKKKDEIMEWVVGTLYMLTLFAAGWFCMVVF